VRGRVEYDDEVIHVIAHHLTDATDRLHALSDDMLNVQTARADHVKHPLPHSIPDGRTMSTMTSADRAAKKGPSARDIIDELPAVRGHPRNHRIIPKSRDFH
jgi:error-prone DNA polymerase